MASGDRAIAPSELKWIVEMHPSPLDGTYVIVGPNHRDVAKVVAWKLIEHLESHGIEVGMYSLRRDEPTWTVVDSEFAGEPDATFDLKIVAHSSAAKSMVTTFLTQSRI